MKGCFLLLKEFDNRGRQDRILFSHCICLHLLFHQYPPLFLPVLLIVLTHLFPAPLPFCCVPRAPPPLPPFTDMNDSSPSHWVSPTPPHSSHPLGHSAPFTSLLLSGKCVHFPFLPSVTVPHSPSSSVPQCSLQQCILPLPPLP